MEPTEEEYNGRIIYHTRRGVVAIGKILAENDGIGRKFLKGPCVNTETPHEKRKVSRGGLKVGEFAFRRAKIR